MSILEIIKIVTIAAVFVIVLFFGLSFVINWVERKLDRRGIDPNFGLKVYKFCRLMLFCNVIGFLVLLAMILNESWEIVFGLGVVILIIFSLIVSALLVIIVNINHIEKARFITIINFASVFFPSFLMLFFYLALRGLGNMSMIP